MARNINEILQELRAAIVADPTLADAYGLDVTKSFDEQFSRVSIEAVDTYIIAASLAVSEKIQENDKSEITAIVERNRIGTGTWYVEMAKRFQWNENIQYFIVVNPADGTIAYNELKPEDRIISQAAYIENTNKEVIIKVATGQPGALMPLSNEQLVDFLNYMKKIKIAGIILKVVNLPADVLRMQANVYYNPAYNQTTLKQKIVQALNDYSIALEFNGVVLRNAIIDAVQRIEGIVDIDITQLQAITGYINYEIERAYSTASGYVNFQQDAVYPLINLIPNI
jgi:hypothetical protein